MGHPSMLKASGAGLAMGVAAGIAATVLALGKMLGLWGADGGLPVAFAVGGALGTVALAVFLVTLVRRSRQPAQ